MEVLLSRIVVNSTWKPRDLNLNCHLPKTSRLQPLTLVAGHEIQKGPCDKSRLNHSVACQDAIPLAIPFS